MSENQPDGLAGKDELDVIARHGDLAQLNEYLKTRPVLLVRRPKRFLDAADFTPEQLLEQIRQDAHDLKNTPFEPWILELDGKKRLPIFSSKEKAQAFAKEISIHLNKVFSLSIGEAMLSQVINGCELDIVDLNLFNEGSREIELRKKK